MEDTYPVSKLIRNGQGYERVTLSADEVQRARMAARAAHIEEFAEAMHDADEALKRGGARYLTRAEWLRVACALFAKRGSHFYHVEAEALARKVDGIKENGGRHD